MAVFGLIATGLALPNFLKAKEEYQAAEKAFNIECAALTFEINRYNSEKYKELEEYNQKALNPDTGMPYSQNDPISGVKMIPILRIYRKGFGILPIPDFYYQRPVVYVDNQTNREITIHQIGGIISCYGSIAAQLGDLSNSRVNIKIAQNEVSELNLSFKSLEFGNDIIKFNNTFQGKEYAERVFKVLKSAGGKIGTIIQSSQKMYMGKDTSPCVMDLEIMYSDNLDKNVRRALYKGIQGSIVYVG